MYRECVNRIEEELAEGFVCNITCAIHSKVDNDIGVWYAVGKRYSVLIS